MPTRKETGLNRVAKAKDRVTRSQEAFEMTLLMAHDFWGASWREIGTAAGIPYGTAQTAAMRAKARLDEAAEGTDDDGAGQEAVEEPVAEVEEVPVEEPVA